MLIDTHSHLNFSVFKDDVDKIIQQALDSNIWMINVGSQYKTSKKAVEIAEKYPKGVYASAGLHPIHSGVKPISVSEGGLTPLSMLAKSKKVVAIGEIGLDYKTEYISFKEKQKEVFLEQLELAKELRLPVIFHCRFAHNDLLKILKLQVSSFRFQGVVHCFTGDWKQAKQYLELGLYLGFNGIIFKFNVDEIIRKTPLDKILLETDCPYLTPPNFEEKRNNPLGVKQVAQKIAEIKKINFQEVAIQTTQNAKQLFNLH